MNLFMIFAGFLDLTPPQDTPGYQTAFCQLVFASKRSPDPYHGSVADPKVHLAQSLQKLSVRCVKE